MAIDKEMFTKQLAQSIARTSGGILGHAQQHPAGRGVSAESKARAGWRDEMSDESRELVEEVVHTGVFGVLAVLDYIRFLENGEEKGSFIPSSAAPSGEQTRIKSDRGETQHNLYNCFSRDAKK
ncbi:hypothetical protein ABM428_14640 (plasmid) [Sulfitobacter sp. TCYB15]|jgi:hypothetical protein|uniref:Uncharacterized protein n=1 Tax=Sulfitobacter sp. TCYB15 TaxID=3229275 RepID=A0AAU8C804_9RHOB